MSTVIKGGQLVRFTVPGDNTSLQIVHFESDANKIFMSDSGDGASITLAQKFADMETPRALTITGDVSGTVQFGTTGDVSISTTVSDDSHKHTGSTISVGTADRVVISNSNSNLVVSSVTATELSYLSGTTGSIQTQLNSKVPIGTGGKIDAAYLPTITNIQYGSEQPTDQDIGGLWFEPI